MSSENRRTQERAEMRERILSAARELFSRHGYRGTTMRAIADRIEYTPTVVYQHFESKDDLIADVLSEDFRSLTRAFVQLGKVEDPVVRLVRAADKYVAFGLEHPRHYELAFMDGHLSKTTQDEVKHGVPGEKVYAFLRVTCEEATAAGRFRPEFENPDEVARMIWSAMHGAVALYIARGTSAGMDPGKGRRTALRTCATLIRGLTPPKG